MAIFRKIHTSFWSDTFIQGLTIEQKAFYLYLLTNEKTKQCGIYEISKKQICFDLDFDLNKVTKFLKFFIDNKKIMYSEATNEIALKNWDRFNGSTSPKVVSCINSELLHIKNTVLIQYVKGIDTASQEEEEQVQEEEQEEKETFDNNSLMSEIEISDVPQEQIDYFNVANAFFQLFQQNAIDLDVRWVHLNKLTYKRCVTPIRLLATSDNRTRDEMLLVFDLLKKDLFWKQNIQSTEKLREKFDQLITKAQNYGKTDKRVTSEPYDLSCFDD
jgi:hypothetical protein